MRQPENRVDRYGRNEVTRNQTYRELAEHYGTAVIPARVRTPKDKAMVEGSVGVISTFILAAIRNEQFLSLTDLNVAIRERLETFNHKPFQKRDGSRASEFKKKGRFCFLCRQDRSNWQCGKWRPSDRTTIFLLMA
ncbi:MAG: transposase family protein [Clostridiales bacterium]|nr:transposase family protein [Clostridiales bacterium]